MFWENIYCIFIVYYVFAASELGLFNMLCLYININIYIYMYKVLSCGIYYTLLNKCIIELDCS